MEQAENITVRLPEDLAEFVERMAKEACNTRSGIIKLAVVKLRQAVEAEAATKAAATAENAA